MIPAYALLLTNLFENNSTHLVFDRCENLHDGRGWTCGIVGFTKEEAGDFKEFLPKFSWTMLGFQESWKTLCARPEFKAKQLEVAEVEFWEPTKETGQRLGAKLPITYAVFFDTLVQHGEGKDPDSFQAILKGWNKGGNEVQELYQFLQRRQAILKSPSNKTTQRTWVNSIDRVLAFKQLLGYRVNEVVLKPQLELKLPIELRTASYSVVLQ
jgi:chitosanase